MSTPCPMYSLAHCFTIFPVIWIRRPTMLRNALTSKNTAAMLGNKTGWIKLSSLPTHPCVKQAKHSNFHQTVLSTNQPRCCFPKQMFDHEHERGVNIRRTLALLHFYRFRATPLTVQCPYIYYYYYL